MFPIPHSTKFPPSSHLIMNSAKMSEVKIQQKKERKKEIRLNSLHFFSSLFFIKASSLTFIKNIQNVTLINHLKLVL